MKKKATPKQDYKNTTKFNQASTDALASKQDDKDAKFNEPNRAELQKDADKAAKAEAARTTETAQEMVDTVPDEASLPRVVPPNQGASELAGRESRVIPPQQ